MPNSGRTQRITGAIRLVAKTTPKRTSLVWVETHVHRQELRVHVSLEKAFRARKSGNQWYQVVLDQLHWINFSRKHSGVSFGFEFQLGTNTVHQATQRSKGFGSADQCRQERPKLAMQNTSP